MHSHCQVPIEVGLVCEPALLDCSWTGRLPKFLLKYCVASIFITSKGVFTLQSFLLLFVHYWSLLRVARLGCNKLKQSNFIDHLSNMI